VNDSLLGALRRQHAAGLGVPEDRVELVQLDLDILNQVGTFVRIRARGLTMFSIQASWAELGVPEQSARQLCYRRPPKDLVEREIIDWFHKTAERARAGLEAVGRKVDFMEPYLWVGNAHWSDWLAGFEQIQARWATYRQEHLLDCYDDLLQRLVDRFEVSALEAYDSLAKAGQPDLPHQADFVEGVVRATLARMPGPKRIEEQLVLDYFTPAVVKPAVLAEELARRDHVRQERRHEAEVAEAQHRQQIELLALGSSAEAEARRAEMQRQRLERLRQQAESTTLPLQQVLEAMRREVGETAQDLLNTLKEHGGLRGRAGERARHLVDSVSMLGALGDQTLMGFVHEAAGLSQSVPGEKNEQTQARVAALTATLNQIGTLLASEQEMRQAVKVVAEEMPRRKWRSVCLNCRHVWASVGSLEPVVCPKCKGNRVASREENNA
jgi:hypothetical protein